MTPKEKARELVDKFENATYEMSAHGHEIYDRCKASKQCALIAVDLLLEEMFFEYEPNFWQQVKSEIKKL